MKTLLTALLAVLTISPISAQSAPSCSEEVLFRFFPREFVVSVLEKNGVSKEQAAKAADELVSKDREVIDKIEAKAASMNPNPLTQHGNPQARADLFKGAITEVFTSVVQNYGLKDNEKVQQALQQIQDMRVQRFEECKNRGMLPREQ